MAFLSYACSRGQSRFFLLPFIAVATVVGFVTWGNHNIGQSFGHPRQVSHTHNDDRIPHTVNPMVAGAVKNNPKASSDDDMKPIIGLAHYTVTNPNIKMQITASAKLLNDNNEYETKYFNNFSQKLLKDGISNRERDVIRLLVLNQSSKQISEKLNISSHTVDTHRRNILKKLNISSTGELIGMLKINKNLL